MSGPDTPKGNPAQDPDENGEDALHVYEAAGIRERTGHVPVWLWAVCVGLAVWGGYYIVRFWTPPG